MKNWKISVGMLLWLVALLIPTACGQAGKQEAPGEEIISVSTERVEHRSIAFPIHTAGMVSRKETIKLSFKVGGIIERINADEGMTVSQGQVMARLILSEINAQAAKARAAFEKAIRDLERARSLYSDKVAPLEQLQDAETAHKLAGSDLEVAEFNLKHSIIQAPSRGKILKRFFEEGELVSSGTPVFIFASTEKNWILRFGVIDRDVVRLHLDDRAEVRFDVYPEKTFQGSVSEIAETAEPKTGTFEVELSIREERGYPLVAGFIAKVDVFPRDARRISLIPIRALIEGEGKEGSVFIIDNSTSRAVKVAVKIERILDDKVAVQSGLENIEEVVSAGASYLTDGTLVRVEGAADLFPAKTGTKAAEE